MEEVVSGTSSERLPFQLEERRWVYAAWEVRGGSMKKALSPHDYCFEEEK